MRSFPVFIPFFSILRLALALALLAVMAIGSTGCAVLAVADAAVTVGATAVKVGAKTVGAVVDVVTPSSDDKDKKDKKDGEKK